MWRVSARRATGGVCVPCPTQQACLSARHGKIPLPLRPTRGFGFGRSRSRGADVIFRACPLPRRGEAGRGAGTRRTREHEHDGDRLWVLAGVLGCGGRVHRWSSAVQGCSRVGLVGAEGDVGVMGVVLRPPTCCPRALLPRTTGRSEERGRGAGASTTVTAGARFEFGGSGLALVRVGGGAVCFVAGVEHRTDRVGLGDGRRLMPAHLLPSFLLAWTACAPG